jgi:sigma-B regulation protein RsbU (phosphoserine phosphatase)
VETLKVCGPAVGLAPQVAYSVSEAMIEPGDLFFAHTDGLSDTINPNDEFLSLEQVIPMFMNGDSLASGLERIQEQIKDFAGAVTQVDDITLLAIKRVE